MASAEPLDPALERLTMNPTGINRPCLAAPGVWNDKPLTTADVADPNDPRVGLSSPCGADNASFKRLISQYAFALAPNAMHSARTTGYGGFHLSIEADYTKISSGAYYWKRGTQGATDPSNGQSSTSNGSVPSLLQLYSLKFRKSFGFGLEITGLVGFMPKTSIVSGGADVRLSLLEGFRTGVGGILPDIAVGGGVRTITGTPQFQLTIAALDAQISKPLPIADSSVITPYVGYQYLWIFGDSGLIDLTPGTDALRYCNYGGQNVPGNSDPGKDNSVGNDGQPVCRGGSPVEFNNNVVFNNARLERHRLIFGLNYRYEMVMLGGQFLIDAVPPADAQNDAADKAILKDEARQWTMSFELGAMF
ncbi:MAG TPA: hypothetical protein VHB79_15755 [Polyangiaceae bacterium]|nr:hypothetical protein [Polyangiaceae bacterium]